MSRDTYLRIRELRLQEEKLALHRERQENRKLLPHLYGLPWYSWQWNFFVSRNKMNLLTAANQIGKSSAQIRKCIHWATEKSLWPELWPKSTPHQFWYFYPASNLATEEFETKWVPEFLPRGKMKDDPKYGWTAEIDKKQIRCIRFNSGIIVYFKTYEQKIKNLQASSVYSAFCDEELPIDFLPEIDARLSGANIQGYFHMVFTATLGQEFWRLTMEAKGSEREKFPDAFKQQISLYDCLVYRNGTPGPWTEDMIKQRIAQCRDENEVQRRVYGKFVSKEGRAYPAYIPDRHLVKPFPIPHDWLIYSAVDNGSGLGAHPPGVVYCAVRPDYRFCAFYKCWRGDNAIYTAGDVIEKWDAMGLGKNVTQSWYDHEARDLKTIADRQGKNLLPADKNRERGNQMLNTLFKHNMAVIFDDEEGEGAKFSGELIGLKQNTPKTKARDDLVDPARYCVIGIPWDWSFIAKETSEDDEKTEEVIKVLSPKELLAEQIRQRRGDAPKDDDPWSELNQEFDEWNEIYG